MSPPLPATNRGATCEPRARQAPSKRRRRVFPRLRRWVLLSVLAIAPTGCGAACDPNAVEMPEGFDEIAMGISELELSKRGTATSFRNSLVLWQGDGVRLHNHDLSPELFLSLYEMCEDSSLCDEIVYNLERSKEEGDQHRLTLMRFGGPMLSKFSGHLERFEGREDRCDRYKQLARELWGDPTSTKLAGRLELFEVKTRVWGAVLCVEGVGGELFVGRPERLRLIHEE